MRTIKFRGKCCHSDAWAYGNLVDYGEDEYPEIQGFDVYHEGRDVWQERSVERDTIGQFTGLHDKNGKEIYEGDILLWTRKNVHIEGRQRQDFSDKCVVYYSNDKCAFQFRYELRFGACVGCLDFDDDRADESFVEVIGNIHDNLKLLKNERED